jgi:hypothetical protein
MAAVMESPNDQVARVDIAARAVVGEELLARMQWVLVAINLLLLIWAFAFKAPYHHFTYLHIATIIAALATSALWFKWRYRIYSLGILLVADLAIGMMLLQKQPYTAADWVGFVVGLVFEFALLFNYIWNCAGPYATVRLPGWERECEQACRWRELLKPGETASGVLEFKTGHWWTERSTYHLLKPGPYWVIAKFNKFITYSLVDFRVRALNEITFKKLTTGETEIRIGDRTLKAVNVSPSTFDFAPGA